jgi:hypothetical protein
VWALPLAASGLAQLAVTSGAGLSSVATEVAAIADGAMTSQDAATLVAECVAAATMGPAYAWPLLLMRVDPPVDDTTLRRESARRAVVVGVLERQRIERDEDARIDDLKREWDAILRSGASEADPSVVAAEQHDVTTKIIDEVMDRMVVIPASEEWDLIGKVAQGLTDDTKPNELVGLSEATKTVTVRVALTAGWVARLGAFDAAKPPNGGLQRLTTSTAALALKVVEAGESRDHGGDNRAPAASPSPPSTIAKPSGEPAEIGRVAVPGTDRATSRFRDQKV